MKNKDILDLVNKAGIDCDDHSNINVTLQQLAHFANLVIESHQVAQKVSESNLIKHAKRELDLIGMTEDDEDSMNKAMRKHILHMVQEFVNEGHSGCSASYAINCLEKLLRSEPLSPLTGDESEWVDRSDGLWQNRRCSHVFKDSQHAYDSTGVIFRESDGDCYTSSDSRVTITFPYTPVSKIVDVD